ILGCAGCQAFLFKRGPGIGNTLAQGGFSARRGIPGDDVEAVGQRASHPAAANDAAAQGREGFDVGDEGHGYSCEFCSALLIVGASLLAKAPVQSMYLRRSNTPFASKLAPTRTYSILESGSTALGQTHLHAA